MTTNPTVAEILASVAIAPKKTKGRRPTNGVAVDVRDGPTPERTAKAPNGVDSVVIDHVSEIDGSRSTTTARRVARPLDTLRAHLAPELWAAGSDYATAREAADLHKRITSRYDGMPQQQSKTVGMYGGMSEAQRKADVRAGWFESILPMRMVAFLRSYVVAGSVGAVDAGAQLAPSYRDKTFHRGVTYGYLLAALDVLDRLRTKERGPRGSRRRGQT